MDFVHYFSTVDWVGGKGRVNPKLLFRVGKTASLSNLPTSRLSRREGEGGEGRLYLELLLFLL